MSTEQNPVLQAMRQRRSIRKFTGEDVPREVLREVVEAGRWAPSGKNNQPYRFLVILPGDPRQEALSQCTAYKKIVVAARALVAVFLDKSRTYSSMKDHQGVGASIQNMLLAVHAQGYGAVWLGEIANQSDQVMDSLGLSPDAYEFQALLAIGKPAAEGSASRLDLEEYLLEDF